MFVRIAPRKVKIVCDLVRGKDYTTAIGLLRATPKAASKIVEKLVVSAAANAADRYGINVTETYVSATQADPGPILKRMMPRAQGRGFRINKRTSHVTVSVTEIK
ncbi:MAG: 50S ribosomal protein L22 [Oscillospiraceae bacterium]|nr:50S ribosomal protein L22 [Oscillospiraceae bacterium]